MSEQHKAIETEYKGHLFRSRLEARWAVVFDALEIKWQYESEGFSRDITTNDGHYTVSYLPDFYLPVTETWVEVKGSDSLLAKDENRLDEFLAHGCPMPGFDDSTATERGLVILGEIPDPTLKGLHLHRVVQSFRCRKPHPTDLWFGWCYFVPAPHPWCCVLMENLLPSFFYPCSTNDMPNWTTQSIHVQSPRYWPEVLNAYRAGRSARFEYGRCGRTL